jgi:hypothetical protein
VGSTLPFNRHKQSSMFHYLYQMFPPKLLPSFPYSPFIVMFCLLSITLFLYALGSTASAASDLSHDLELRVMHEYRWTPIDSSPFALRARQVCVVPCGGGCCIGSGALCVAGECTICPEGDVRCPGQAGCCPVGTCTKEKGVCNIPFPPGGTPCGKGCCNPGLVCAGVPGSDIPVCQDSVGNPPPVRTTSAKVVPTTASASIKPPAKTSSDIPPPPVSTNKPANVPPPPKDTTDTKHGITKTLQSASYKTTVTPPATTTTKLGSKASTSLAIFTSIASNIHQSWIAKVWTVFLAGSGVMLIWIGD